MPRNGATPLGKSSDYNMYNVSILLWEQDVACSNHVAPTSQSVRPPDFRPGAFFCLARPFVRPLARTAALNRGPKTGQPKPPACLTHETETETPTGSGGNPVHQRRPNRSTRHLRQQPHHISGRPPCSDVGGVRAMLQPADGGCAALAPCRRLSRRCGPAGACGPTAGPAASFQCVARPAILPRQTPSGHARSRRCAARPRPTAPGRARPPSTRRGPP